MNISIKTNIRERFENADYSSRPSIEGSDSILIKKRSFAQRRPIAPAKPPLRLG